MLHLQAAGGAKKQPAPPLRLTAEQQGPCAPRRRVPLGTRHALRGRGAELCPLLGSEGSAVKTLPALQGTQAPSRSWEGPPEKGMATHSVSLPGESPGAEALAGLIRGVANYNRTERRTLSLSRLLVNLSEFKYQCL